MPPMRLTRRLRSICVLSCSTWDLSLACSSLAFSMSSWARSRSNLALSTSYCVNTLSLRYLCRPHGDFGVGHQLRGFQFRLFLAGIFNRQDVSGLDDVPLLHPHFP